MSAVRSNPLPGDNIYLDAAQNWNDACITLAKAPLDGCTTGR